MERLAKSIFFVGIGGARLNALAKLYTDRGYQVSGSDRQESKATLELEKRGIRVYYNDNDPTLIDDVDMVVYSNAVGEDNPQVVTARQKGIHVLEGSELLGRLMDEVGNGIAVSGTHGKTTTTSMLAQTLTKAGLDPTVLVGGELSAIGGNHRTGKSPHIVVEACEFRRSFLELSPKIAIVTNMDWDHPDCFPTHEAVIEVFAEFVSSLPKDGLLVINGDDPNCEEIIKSSPATAVTFGRSENCDIRILHVHPCSGELGSVVKIMWRERFELELHLRVPGKHNVMNAVAAMAAAEGLGVDPKTSAELLQEFLGVRRRFEIKGEVDGIWVVDDYAHHPAAIATTLATVRNHYAGRIWCVFQPHTFTRTRYLFDEFAKAFGDCDILILDDIYSAREQDTGEISSRTLAERARSYHSDVRYIAGQDAIIEHLLEKAHPGDLIITMGAGDIWKVGEHYLDEKGSISSGSNRLRQTY